MGHKTKYPQTLQYPVLIMAAGAAVLTAVIALVSAEIGVWGGLIGFLIGMAESLWLFGNLRRAMKDEMAHLLARYRRNMVVRWGSVAVFAFLMVRFFYQGLLFMVIGFALGMLALIFLVARQMTNAGKEKGGEN